MKVTLAVALLLVAGCGGGSDVPACPPPLVGSCTSHTGLFCTEYAGVPTAGVAAVMSSCRGDPGEPDIWSPSGCNQDGTLGACKNMQQGLCVAVWLKLPPGAATTAQAKSMCAAQGGTWVDR